MRPLFLIVLFAGFAVGCTSTNNGRYDRSGRAYPGSARVDNRNARPGSAARPYVCHNGNTIAVSRNAVRAHRRHGDSLGACSRREARRDQRDRRVERRDDRRDDRSRRQDRRGRDYDHKHNGRHDRDH